MSEPRLLLINDQGQRVFSSRSGELWTEAHMLKYLPLIATQHLLSQAFTPSECIQSVQQSSQKIYFEQVCPMSILCACYFFMADWRRYMGHSSAAANSAPYTAITRPGSTALELGLAFEAITWSNTSCAWVSICLLIWTRSQFAILAVDTLHTSRCPCKYG